MGCAGPPTDAAVGSPRPAGCRAAARWGWGAVRCFTYIQTPLGQARTDNDDVDACGRGADHARGREG
jgi:hypothetical protein